MNRNSFGKNTQMDYRMGLILVRDTASNDTPMSLAPGTAVPAADANVLTLVQGASPVRGVYCEGARTMMFRLWGTVTGGTAVFTLKAFRLPGPYQLPLGAGLTKSKGSTRLVGTVTFSGSNTANTHPVTGTAVAATTFFEASAFTASYEQDPAVRYYPTAGSATGQELFVTVDCLGADILVPEITSISNSARILVGAARID